MGIIGRVFGCRITLFFSLQFCKNERKCKKIARNGKVGGKIYVNNVCICKEIILLPGTKPTVFPDCQD